MRLLLPALLIITLLAAGTPAASTAHGVDFTITFRADGTWTYDGPLGLLTPRNETRGERYTWDITVPSGAAVGEVRYALDTFDVMRPKQVQPGIDGDESRFPLFHYFPRPAVWEADDVAQVYHLFQADGEHVLRLQIPQITGGVFTLERDVAAPNHTLGTVERVTQHSFYQETRTDEPAIADVQVRPAGSDREWVRNPTPDFHVLQRFPIQGLDAGTTYEVRVVFTDWSNNSVTTEVYHVTSLPDEAGAPPTFEVLSPEPDATLPSGTEVVVRVRLLDGDTPVDPGSVRVFFDLDEVSRGGFTLEGDVMTYPVGVPADGTHVVSVEAQTTDGAQDHVRWTFHVGEAAVETSPGAGPLLVLTGLFVALLVRLRRLPS